MLVCSSCFLYLSISVHRVDRYIGRSICMHVLQEHTPKVEARRDAKGMPGDGHVTAGHGRQPPPPPPLTLEERTDILGPRTKTRGTRRREALCAQNPKRVRNEGCSFLRSRVPPTGSQPPPRVAPWPCRAALYAVHRVHKEGLASRGSAGESAVQEQPAESRRRRSGDSKPARALRNSKAPQKVLQAIRPGIPEPQCNTDPPIDLRQNRPKLTPRRFPNNLCKKDEPALRMGLRLPRYRVCVTALTSRFHNSLLPVLSMLFHRPRLSPRQQQATPNLQRRTPSLAS